jgi:hypothetical protein
MLTRILDTSCVSSHIANAEAVGITVYLYWDYRSMTRQSWREWKMFPHMIYFIKNFCTFNTIFEDNVAINCIKRGMATKARFLPNAPTRNRPPDSRLPPNADSADPTIPDDGGSKHLWNIGQYVATRLHGATPEKTAIFH